MAGMDDEQPFSPRIPHRLDGDPLSIHTRDSLNPKRPYRLGIHLAKRLLPPSNQLSRGEVEKHRGRHQVLLPLLRLGTDPPLHFRDSFPPQTLQIQGAVGEYVEVRLLLSLGRYLR